MVDVRRARAPALPRAGLEMLADEIAVLETVVRTTPDGAFDVVCVDAFGNFSRFFPSVSLADARAARGGRGDARALVVNQQSGMWECNRCGSIGKITERSKKQSQLLQHPRA